MRPEAREAILPEGSDRQALSVNEIPDRPWLPQAIVLAVLSSSVALQVVQQLTAPIPLHGAELAVDSTAVIALFALTVSATLTAAEHWPQWRRLVTLLAEALITYLPLIIIGKTWAGMAGFFAGSAALLLSGWAAWVLFAGAIGSMFAVSVISHFGAYEVAYLTVSTAVLGLVVFGIARLSLVIRHTHSRSGELAQLAIINERMGFARDLHDLLGYSLSAITLKTEFTRRLVTSNPGRARDELSEVIDIARQALADVRIVASGYRRTSLAKEASPISSLLSAAGINTKITINCGVLDEKVDTVLAAVLREAVSNMLRHSNAQNCTVEAGITGDVIRLLIANDGVPSPATSGRSGSGSGLENLSARMATIGGRLTTCVPGDGWFKALAEAPLTPAPAGKISDPGETQP